MSNRLDTVAAGLAATLEQAERHLRDRAVLEACQRAVVAAMAADPLLDRALNQLRDNVPGTDRERARPELTDPACAPGISAGPAPGIPAR